MDGLDSWKRGSTLERERSSTRVTLKERVALILGKTDLRGSVLLNVILFWLVVKSTTQFDNIYLINSNWRLMLRT